MKRFRLFATAAAIAAVSITPVATQGKSGAAPKGGKQPTTSAAPTNHGQSQKVSGNTSPSTSTSPGSNGAARSAAAKASNPGVGNKPATTTAGTTTGTTTTGTTTTGTTTGTTTTGTTTTAAATPNALEMKISKNPAQAARITKMLEAYGGGMTLSEATLQARNQGQLIAALNPAKNHKVS